HGTPRPDRHRPHARLSGRQPHVAHVPDRRTGPDATPNRCRISRTPSCTGTRTPRAPMVALLERGRASAMAAGLQARATSRSGRGPGGDPRNTLSVHQLALPGGPQAFGAVLSGEWRAVQDTRRDLARLRAGIQQIFDARDD